jgi:DNA-directed RNA polymerase specialized sigma24 family protein
MTGTTPRPPAESELAEPPEGYWDALYDELRRIAHSLMRGQNWTRQPTELVNDAYLREQRSAPFRFKDQTHFRAAMARRLRQVYLDEWKRRTAARRDAGKTERLDDHEVPTPAATVDPDQFQLVTLTFDHLEQNWPGLGRLLEQRVFGELTVAELAKLHGVEEGAIRMRLHRARQRAAEFLRAHRRCGS